MSRILLPAPGPHQIPKLLHPARHKITCAGRRWRKSTMGLLAAIEGHGPGRCHRGALAGANLWWVSESFPVSVSIWRAISGTLRDVAKDISETERRVLLPGDGAITVKSAENPESLKGDIRGIDGVILDEAAQHDPLVWQRSVRPLLADRHGWSFWLGTPRGFNHFKTMFDLAETEPDWARWREPSTANPFFDPVEIEKSRREGMPPAMISQEYFAEFVLSGPGRTYYEFVRHQHVREYEPDPTQPIDLCVSFNVAPPAWLIAQGNATDVQPERVLDEIAVEAGDTSVRAYLTEFRSRYPDSARGENVRVFGDATSVAGRKSTGPSDYELIRQGLPEARYLVRFKAPPEKDRINATNLALRDQRGKVRAYVDPSCEQLIRDLEYVLNTDSSYQVDHSTPGLGHYASAWGHKLLWCYPLLATQARTAEERKAEERKDIRERGQRTPEAARAYAMLRRAIRAGKIRKGERCEKCGCQPPLEGAHTDYARPLEVRWLCPPCHGEWDRRAPKGGTR